DRHVPIDAFGIAGKPGTRVGGGGRCGRGHDFLRMPIAAMGFAPLVQTIPRLDVSVKQLPELLARKGVAEGVGWWVSQPFQRRLKRRPNGRSVDVYVNLVRLRSTMWAARVMIPTRRAQGQAERFGGCLTFGMVVAGRWLAAQWRVKP